ncbi:hypothetical protein [Actinomadura parmotrematis]|uniref:Uncharacterized protein n=1 Tax=Actinomadura parmotrematis TaxID=2864039 RepID=A0ABS7FMR8_9ACTN|nr:hypothetical protein [Actinomadura parmotrematis]MBW8481290.1 hypothetical protein [Actinomadura parmotrematis]
MSRAEVPTPELAEAGPGPAGRGRSAVALVTAAGCAAVLAVAGVRLGGELTRGPSAAELAAAARTEVAQRYRVWSAGRIFPARLAYTLDMGSAETARRVGIDPGTACADGVDAALAPGLDGGGCRALLRATYLDQAQGLAVTVGVAAFPDAGRAAAAARRFPAAAPRPGLRALGFPASVAARFGDAARQAAAVRQSGPYVVAATVGYADGRPAVAGRKQDDVASLGPQLAGAVLRPLAAVPRVVCADPEWSC